MSDDLKGVDRISSISFEAQLSEPALTGVDAGGVLKGESAAHMRLRATLHDGSKAPESMHRPALRLLIMLAEGLLRAGDDESEVRS